MLEYIFDGGPLMYLIALMSVIGLAVIIDRVAAFRAASPRNNADLKNAVIDALREGDPEKARRCCIEQGSPVAAILLAGLNKFVRLEGHAEYSAPEIGDMVRKSMEDYAPRVLNLLERNIGILQIVASLSPLLGMTGTVTGMIGSFKAMSEATALEASTVSGGISEALITTAAGLLVAMPSLIAYNFFNKKIDECVLEIESAASELVDFITLDYYASSVGEDGDAADVENASGYAAEPAAAPAL